MSKGQIVFFDATEVRREKMRNAAMGVKETKVANKNVEFVDKNVAPPLVEPAPRAEVKVEKQEPKIEKPAAAAAPAVSISPKELEAELVAFVVEQTGYPEEMVEMDVDLEGDLGIDSIKKAQLMGELNEKYHFVDLSSPADADMSLDDFPTLGTIRDYLLSKTSGKSATAAPAPAQTSACAPAPQAPAGSSISKEELEAELVGFVVEQTGYPEDMVEMDVDLEGDLGIDSIKKAQLMGELNEKYHFVDLSSPADADMSLDDFPTLGTIRDYLLSKTSGKPSTAASAAPADSTPAPAAQTSAAASISKEELEAELVNFVVEQTGYPEDMVEMDVDLEGDLGIDSIKKAQLMGELNEKYHFVDLSSPADADMSLDDFPTLGTIRDYLLSKSTGKSTTAASAAPAAKSSGAASISKEELEAELVNFVVEQTGYPEEMVEMDVDLEGDLGIDSIKKAQLMGELNEKYHFVDLSSPADADMSLDDFPTLGTIRDYLLSKAK